MSSQLADAVAQATRDGLAKGTWREMIARPREDGAMVAKMYVASECPGLFDDRYEVQVGGSATDGDRFLVSVVRRHTLPETKDLSQTVCMNLDRVKWLHIELGKLLEEIG